MLGQTILHYGIERKLGEGGMGEVFLAQDTRLKRSVALKFLPRQLSSDPQARKQLLREAQSVAKLRHPNIVSVYSVESTEDTDFIVMEFIEGDTLEIFIRGEDRPIGRILNIATQICLGLGYAHRVGVVHRDLKPSNIILEEDGRVRILDFGIAKTETSSVSQSGGFIGTPAYMAPEQLKGQPIDARSDIFNIGLLLFEMTTGTRPFSGENGAVLLYAVCEQTHPSPRQLRPSIPSDLEFVIDRCLQKRKVDRFSTAMEVSSALSRVAELMNLETPGDQPRQSMISRPRLAVLPFENLGPADAAYFAAGMTDEISTRLGKTKDIAVIARSSTLKYDGRTSNLRTIAMELSVDYIVEGTVYSAVGTGGAAVRINARLVRSSDEVQVWGERYSDSLAEVFSIQDRVAGEIARALSSHFTEIEPMPNAKKPTDNLDAYDAYLRGLQFMDADTSPQVLQLATRMFEKATMLDPVFAQAHAWGAMSKLRTYWHYYDRSAGVISAAHESIEKALQLEPELPEGHEALGLYYHYATREYEKAHSEFELALARNPNSATAMVNLAGLERRMGQWDAGLARYKQALLIDPRSAWTSFEVGRTCLDMRKFDEAERMLKGAIELSPDLSIAYESLSYLHVRRNGDLVSAKKLFQDVKSVLPDNRLSYDWVWLFIWSGEYENALSILGPLHQDDTLHVQALHHLRKGEIYGHMKNESLALDHYRSAYDILDKILSESPDEAHYHCWIGFACAGVGHNDEAVAHGRRAIELMPLSKDAVSGAHYLMFLAAIYAMTGQRAEAVQMLDYLLTIPGPVTIPFIRLNPDLEPLRADHEFQSLLAREHTM